MEFTLVRTYGTDYDTLGYILVDGKEFCKTLEDGVRDKKIKSQTCIPYGDYSIQLTFSPKFNKTMPLIYNDSKTLAILAENGDRWDGVRVHGGNTNLDTDGCILVAKTQYKNQEFIGKKNVDGTNIMNYISGSMADEFRNLFTDTKTVHTFKVIHIDSLKKETLYKLRNPAMKDNNIYLIQKALISKGYKLDADGYFGKDTDSAVKNYQTKNGLVSDGIVGKSTLSKLGLTL